MPERAEFRESLRTPACARAAHQDCPHISGMGGGFNPRRLRLEFGAGLCPCACHSSSPVALPGGRLSVPKKTWGPFCPRPGAEHERRRLAEAGVEIRAAAEIRRDADRLSRPRREACPAARARAAGATRDEVRYIYHPLPAARIAGEGPVRMGRTLYGIAKLLRPDQ